MDIRFVIVKYNTQSTLLVFFEFVVINHTTKCLTMGQELKLLAMKLWQRTLLDFVSKCLDIRERERSTVLPLSIDKKQICSLDVSRQSTVIPKSYRSVGGWRQTSTLVVSVCGSISSDNIVMNLNLDGLAFIQSSSNHFNIFFFNWMKWHSHLETSVTQNYHLNNGKSCSFPWIKTHHS